MLTYAVCHHLLSYFLYVLPIYDGTIGRLCCIPARILYGGSIVAFRGCAILKNDQTMALAAVMVVNIFTGFSAKAWNAWIFVTVFFGIVVIWCFTVSFCNLWLADFWLSPPIFEIIYSAVSPGYAVTDLYGSYYILLASPYFWFSLPITFFLSLAPRFTAQAWKAGYTPDDLDIMRYISKYEPDRDFAHDAHISNLKALRPGSAASQRHASRASVNTGASRTDLATGVVSADRGFDFAQEEGGVALRRMQTNLSEAAASRQQISAPRRASMKGKEALSHMFSLRKSSRKKKSTKQTIE